MTGADPVLPDAGEAVADILRAAYYYATVDGHATVGADLLLTAAVRNDEYAASLLGAAVADARATLKPEGRLAMPVRPVVASSCPYAGALREARWWVLRDSKEIDRQNFDVLTAQRGGPVWSPEVCAALVRAGREAIAVGVPWVGVEQLLVGLLDEHDGSIRSLAQSSRLDVAGTVRRVRIGGLVATPRPDTPPLLQMLQMFGAIEEREAWLVRWIPRWMARMAVRDARLGGPVLACLEEEALRQAVIVGHDSVQTGAVLLAILSLDEQLETSGQRLRTAFVAHNQGSRLLVNLGVDLRRAQRVAEGITDDGPQLSPEESAGRFWASGKPGDPPWDETAAALLDRAGALAQARDHPDIGTSHLLAAVLEDSGSAAVRVLGKLGIDHLHVRARISEQLAGA